MPGADEEEARHAARNILGKYRMVGAEGGKQPPQLTAALTDSLGCKGCRRRPEERLEESVNALHLDELTLRRPLKFTTSSFQCPWGHLASRFKGLLSYAELSSHMCGCCKDSLLATEIRPGHPPHVARVG